MHAITKENISIMCAEFENNKKIRHVQTRATYVTKRTRECFNYYALVVYLTTHYQ